MDNAALWKKVPVYIECLVHDETISSSQVKVAIMSFLESHIPVFRIGRVDISPDAALGSLVKSLIVTDFGINVPVVAYWRAEVLLHIYSFFDQSNPEGLIFTVDDSTDIPSFTTSLCPNKALDQLWESIYVDRKVKDLLLTLAQSAMMFSLQGVDQRLVSGNKLILLYGPPGSGKTTLGRGLAQKLAIRYSDDFAAVELLSINAHALLSKFFGESSSLVLKVFTHIRDRVSEDTTTFFILLIDEVETIVSSRESSLGKGSAEPSDAIRVVNAVLTELDRLKQYPNVLTLCTSNFKDEALDLAFLDRCDLKIYLGPPNMEGRYSIIQSTLVELMRCTIISPAVNLPESIDFLTSATTTTWMSSAAAAAAMTPSSPDLHQQLLRIVELTEAFSGRSLRKLPLQAHALLATHQKHISLSTFLDAMEETVKGIRHETDLHNKQYALEEGQSSRSASTSATTPPFPTATPSCSTNAASTATAAMVTPMRFAAPPTATTSTTYTPVAAAAAEAARGAGSSFYLE